MRKISFIILAVIAFVFCSCRKTPDYVPYIGESSKLAYSTYAEQFDVLWNNINKEEQEGFIRQAEALV